MTSTSHINLANSQRSDPYFSDWARMGLPEGRGANAFTAHQPPPVQEYRPSKLRMLPNIALTLSEEEKRAERNLRNRAYMAAKRSAMRAAKTNSLG
jgi:hypothetical protein